MEFNKKLLSLDLQFFAKDGPGGEKTEDASSKKLSDARKKGQVAKSKDLVSAIFLVTIFATLKSLLGNLFIQIEELFSKTFGMFDTLANPIRNEINHVTVMAIMQSVIIDFLFMIAPFLMIAFFIGVIGDLVQVKWKPTGEPLKPKLSNINPLKGFSKLFSKQSLMNLFKSVVLVTVMFYYVYNALIDEKNMILNLYEVPLSSAILIIGNLVIDLVLQMCIIYLIIGLADYVFQKRKFKEDMKMTKQEVKDEYKNSEGDPKIKAQIRKKMMQVSQRRMMQQLPEADVVITNPTHFAVALKYDSNIAKAPVVIAKGEDYLALRIKEKAKEYSIETVENKPLARSLYQSCDIGSEIPEELYQAVAEVLAVVFKTKKAV